MAILLSLSIAIVKKFIFVSGVHHTLCPNTPRPPGQDAVGVVNPLRLRLQRLSQCIGHLVQRLPVLFLLATAALPVAEAVVGNSVLAHCGLSSSSKVISSGCGTLSCAITPSSSAGRNRPHTRHQYPSSWHNISVNADAPPIKPAPRRLPSR